MENKVRRKFNLYPDQIKAKMESLRNLIYEVAQNTEGVGELEETLKWGEPSYLPFQTKSGTTIRIDWKPEDPDQIGMYVNCNTTLISTFRNLFQDKLKFEGNRTILFSVDEPLPKKELMICIQMAFRYHLDKNTKHL